MKTINSHNKERQALDDYEDQLEYIQAYHQTFLAGGKICPTCNIKSVRCETFDSYYCPQCRAWLEGKCKDKCCKFCANRPDKAVDYEQA